MIASASICQVHVSLTLSILPLHTQQNNKPSFLFEELELSRIAFYQSFCFAFSKLHPSPCRAGSLSVAATLPRNRVVINKAAISRVVKVVTKVATRVATSKEVMQSSLRVEGILRRALEDILVETKFLFVSRR